jgi:uncharacterized protein YndB with AHSA1/START domain
VTTENIKGRLEHRWNRRHDAERDGTEPLTVQSTVEISKPAQEVWDFLTSPYAGVLLDHQHVTSFPVPGTPEGVGHQSCSLRRGADGRLEATVTEIIEFEPPHRYVAKWLTGPSETLDGIVVRPTPTGCTYSARVGMRIVYGTAGKVAPVAQRAIDELTAKVRSIVESGVRFEPVKESPETSGGEGGSDSVSPPEDLP